jgi:CcmD family protein
MTPADLTTMATQAATFASHAVEFTAQAAAWLGNAAAHAARGLAAIQAATPDTTFAAGEAAARPDQVERGLRFLNAAYTAVWVILAAYLVLISVRQRRLERQMLRLRQRLGLDAPPGRSDPR